MQPVLFLRLEKIALLPRQEIIDFLLSKDGQFYNIKLKVFRPQIQGTDQQRNGVCHYVFKSMGVLQTSQEVSQEELDKMEMEVDDEFNPQKPEGYQSARQNYLQRQREREADLLR